MKATDLLELQHRQVEQLFGRIERTIDAMRLMQLRDELATRLLAHSRIEREIYYPSCVAEAGETLIDLCFEEHALQEFAVSNLFSVPVTDPSFPAKMHVLQKLVFDHIAEERESVLPASERLGEARLEELGEDMQQLHEQSMELGLAGLVEHVRRSAPDGERHAA